MYSEYVLVGLISAVIGALVCWVVMRWRAGRRLEQVRQLESATRDLERRSHLMEREHAKEIAQLESELAETIKRERTVAYEEGRQLGRTEGHVDRLRETSKMESEFDDRLRNERKRAAEEAREQARIQFEQQQKLFSVEVRPFYEVVEVSRYLKTSLEERVGYQYQLLVNGIPAFQPHLIIESTERRARTKDENVDKLATKALQAAQGAIETYLGGAGAFVKLGKVIKRLPGNRR